MRNLAIAIAEIKCLMVFLYIILLKLIFILFEVMFFNNNNPVLYIRSEGT